MGTNLRPGWVESLGQQLGAEDRARPPAKQSVLPPEVLEARKIGREKYWEQVRSGQRTRTRGPNKPKAPK